MMKNIKEICFFGFAYSCVIGFCLFGPIMRIVIEKDTFTCAVLALIAFILAFINPFFHFFKKKKTIAAYVILSILMIFLKELEEVIVFLFSFEIATLCRSFTLYVTNRLNESQSEQVMALAFTIAFSVLYIINVTEPLLSLNIALGIIVFLGYAAIYFYKITIPEDVITKKYNSTFDKYALLPLISLYLVYIGGGISYAGIYPYLEMFYNIDRFYNVLPLVIFMPIAGFTGKKYGNLINLFMGIIFLSIAFTFFMFRLTEINYFFIQTFLQIGWAFTNVFGFSYSWRLACKYSNPYIFGYGIIFILLGVTSGSVIANYIIVSQLSVAFFGPFTFIPLIVSLVFQFFYSDIKTVNNIDSGRERGYRNFLEEDVFYHFSILSELTNREKEIIYHYYNSDTAVKIADKLQVSPNTVRTHIKNAYSKLGVSKREQLQDLINRNYNNTVND